jgi:hypothetical protein
MTDVKVEKKKEKSSKNERQVFTSLVREQIAPFYNVVSAGLTVEWTDKMSEATAAYKTATLPKRIWRINGPDIALVSAEG